MGSTQNSAASLQAVSISAISFFPINLHLTQDMIPIQMATQPEVTNTREQHDAPHNSKTEGNDAVAAIEVDPSPEVSKKRQRLSDLFTIVRIPFMPDACGLPTMDSITDQ